MQRQTGNRDSPWRLRRGEDNGEDPREDLEESRWKILERIGTYAADELSGEETRDVERLDLEDPKKQRLATSYRRILDLLRTVAEKPLEVPEVVVGCDIGRAAVENRAAEEPRQSERGKAG